MPVTIAEPKPDLATMFAGNMPVSVRQGRHTDASLTVQNLGNLKSSATVSVRLYASPNPSADPASDPSARLLVTMPAKKVTIRPGQSKNLPVRFVAPKGDVGGTYFLAAVVTSTQPPDTRPAQHVAVIGTM